jgi:hypothetical protein
VIARVVRGRREPRVGVGGVSRHQVQQQPDTAHAGLIGQFGQVVVISVARVDGEVVGDVVTGVAHRGDKTGVEPHRRDPEPGQVVQVLRVAAQVADPVAVRVGEALRVDLVQDGIAQPGRYRHARVSPFAIGAPAGNGTADPRPLPRLRPARRQHNPARGGAYV